MGTPKRSSLSAPHPWGRSGFYAKWLEDRFVRHAILRESRASDPGRCARIAAGGPSAEQDATTDTAMIHMIPSDQLIGNFPPNAFVEPHHFRPTNQHRGKAVLEQVELVDCRRPA